MANAPSPRLGKAPGDLRIRKVETNPRGKQFLIQHDDGSWHETDAFNRDQARAELKGVTRKVLHLEIGTLASTQQLIVEEFIRARISGRYYSYGQRPHIDALIICVEPWITGLRSNQYYVIMPDGSVKQDITEGLSGARAYAYGTYGKGNGLPPDNLELINLQFIVALATKQQDARDQRNRNK